MTLSLLVIEDDPTFNALLSRALGRRGYTVSSAQDVNSALAAAQAASPVGIVLDLNLGATSGLNLIRPLLDIVPGCLIVVLTGYASIATAVEAIKLVEVEAIIAAFDATVSASFADAVPPTGNFMASR